MDTEEAIYILGSGAIGFPLAAYLTRAGRRAVAVRTSRTDVPRGSITVTVDDGNSPISVPVETVSLSRLASLEGMMVVTAKAHANETIARALREKAASGPLVIMQNGVGIERPFLEAGLSPICRCILYVTAQATSPYHFSFRPVTASPLGLVRGDDADLQRCVEALNTPAFPFRSEVNIEREIWKKAIINAVFNSICPLLDVDNGIFARDEAVAGLARDVVGECVALTDRLSLELDGNELMEQLLLISKRSDGQLISTLQDIKSGRSTEIEFLNLEIARVAASLQPPLLLPRTELLGKMILARSLQQSEKEAKE